MGSRVDDNRIRLSGVYQISNTIDSRVYIGSSISMYNRFSKHRCSFKFNRHENPNLLKFYNKYGLKCLKFEILEYCKPSMLKEREGFYLSRVENLFNVCMYPYSAKGFKHSIETCKKLSKIHSGKVLSEEDRKSVV